MNSVGIISLTALVAWCGFAAAEPGREAGAAPAAPVPTAFQRQAGLFLQKCDKCHTIGRGDRVGPDLKGVLDRRDREWLIGFIQTPGRFLDTDPVAKSLLAKYQGVRMDDLGLSREQVEDVLAYIDTAGRGGAGGDGDALVVAPPPVSRVVVGPDETPGGAAAAVLALVALVAAAAAWRFRMPTPAAVGLLVAAASGYWASGGSRLHRLPGHQQGYAPEQPIAYSHALHAGDLGIACVYCHHGAEKGPVAGVPAVSICMNCHGIVRGPAGSPGPSPELQKLFQVWEKRDEPDARSIEWIRVHRLPDFVAFSHRAHVGNGIRCQECHGPVENMVRMRQAASLSMGWCLDCHARDASPSTAHWKRTGGPMDCAACHQ